MTENLLLFAVALGATLAVVLLTRRRVQRSQRDVHIVPSETEPRARSRTEAREISELLVQLEQAAREVTAQIDTRYLKLESAIRAADQRLARLEKAESGERSSAPPSPQPRPGLDVVIDDEGVTGDQSADTSDGRSWKTEVCRLADSGHSAVQIARSVNRPVGEVELVLSLRAADASVR